MGEREKTITVHIFAIMLLLLFITTAQAAVVPIAGTGYSLNVPNNFKNFRPPGAPDILLQSDSPTGEASIQVVSAAGGTPVQTIISNYEATMKQALPSLKEHRSSQKIVAGQQAVFKKYSATDGGVKLRIFAVFYSDPDQGFVIHSLDQNGNALALRGALLSLQPPRSQQRSQVASTPPPSAQPKSIPQQAAPQSMGKTLSSLQSPSVQQPPQIANTPPPPPAQPARPQVIPPQAAPQFNSYHEQTSALTVPYPDGWEIEKSSSVVTIGGPQGTPAYETTINIQALSRSHAANRDLTAAVNSFSSGLAGMGGKIDVSEATSVGGVPAWRIYAVANANGATHVFRYLLVERPEVIGVVSFVAPVAAWNDYLPLVEKIEAGITLDSQVVAQAAQPVQPPAPRATANPSTSREAYLLLQQSAAAGDWPTVVNMLTDNSLLSLCRGWRDSIPDADLTEADAKANPAATALEYLNYAKGRERMSWLARPGNITGIREENGEMHLVMVSHGPKNPHYYWMKKIDGRWKYDFN